MSCLHTAIPTPSFCSFWHGHPYIPIHFLKMFFIYSDDTGEEGKKGKINFRPGIKPSTQRLGVQYTRHQAITQDKSLSPHCFLCTTSGHWPICQTHTGRPPKSCAVRTPLGVDRSTSPSGRQDLSDSTRFGLYRKTCSCKYTMNMLVPPSDSLTNAGSKVAHGAIYSCCP